MNDPFSGLLGDLLKVMGGAPGTEHAWLDAARALAHGVATDGQPEENPDPIARIHLGELARVAELHVTQTTGLAFERPPELLGVSRGAWALRVLDAWAPVLGPMVDAARTTPVPPVPQEDDPGAATLFARMATTLGPVLLGLQFGSAAGHLAQRTLGQYALVLPWPSATEVLVVADNVARFAEEWSIPLDQVQLWVCVRELTTHAVLSRPHVAERIRTLVGAHTLDMVSTNQGLAQRLGKDATDPEALQRILSDPEALLSDLLTPGQRRTSHDLVAVTSVIAAYVDHVTRTVASLLTGGVSTMVEAWYRYRIEEAAADQAAGALFGLDLTRAQVDRGAAFIRGVIDRAGEDGLAQLWDDPLHLPTPAEVDAPGLWLARIALPQLPGDPQPPGKPEPPSD